MVDVDEQNLHTLYAKLASTVLAKTTMAGDLKAESFCGAIEGNIMDR